MDHEPDDRLRRNGVSLLKGIDTVHSKDIDLAWLCRNGESPTKGIDTQQLSDFPCQLLCEYKWRELVKGHEYSI